MPDADWEGVADKVFPEGDEPAVEAAPTEDPDTRRQLGSNYDALKESWGPGWA